MAYPLLSAWTITLKHNVADDVATATSAPLHGDGTDPTGVIKGDATEFLGGFTKASRLKRREFKIVLMPYVFPSHMPDYDAMEAVLLSGKFMWLYSDGTDYPYAIADVQVYVSGYTVAHEDDGTKRIEVTFTTADYL